MKGSEQKRRGRTLKQATVDKRRPSMANSSRKGTTFGARWKMLRDELLKSLSTSVNRLKKSEQVLSLDSCVQLTATFSSAAVLAYEKMIFGEKKPSTKLMNEFLLAHAGVDLTDEQRKTISDAIRLVSKKHHWQVNYHDDINGQVEPAQISTSPTTGRATTRFQIFSERSGKRRSLSGKLVLPTLTVAEVA